MDNLLNIIMSGWIIILLLVSAFMGYLSGFGHGMWTYRKYYLKLLDEYNKLKDEKRAN